MVSNMGSEAYLYCQDLPNTSHTIDLGCVSSITEPYTTSLSKAPIMGLPAERRIITDLSVTNSKTLSYKRVSPKEPIDDYTVDSKNWSNGFWIFNMWTYVINRFQMNTDGCKLTFKVVGDDGGMSELYPSHYGINGYIDRMGIGYSAGNPFEISGDFVFVMGSCKGSKSGINVITYHSNFASLGASISEATYCQVYYNDNPEVDTYPVAWEQILSAAHISMPSRKNWWWSAYESVSFESCFNSGDDGKKNRAFRWEESDGSSSGSDKGWKDLPDYVKCVQGGTTDLYARYDGFTKKW